MYISGCTNSDLVIKTFVMYKTVNLQMYMIAKISGNVQLRSRPMEFDAGGIPGNIQSWCT